MFPSHSQFHITGTIKIVPMIESANGRVACPWWCWGFEIDDFLPFLPIFYDSVKIKYCLIDKTAPMTKPQRLTGNVRLKTEETTHLTLNSRNHYAYKLHKVGIFLPI